MYMYWRVILVVHWSKIRRPDATVERKEKSSIRSQSASRPDDSEIAKFSIDR